MFCVVAPSFSIHSPSSVRNKLSMITTNVFSVWNLDAFPPVTRKLFTNNICLIAIQLPCLNVS